MHATPAHLALAAAAIVVVRWAAENGRLHEELDWHRERLNAATTALDGASAVIACGRSFDSERSELPAESA
jgi:hypothetical protein